MNAIAKRLPTFIGGSADLNPSTYTILDGMGDFQSPERPRGGPETGAVGGEWSYAGRNIAYGVREHAMAAASNGIAAHGGLIPYCATFFVFSDYMRPAIRLAAISALPVKFVFTHDSIGLGEDGTTHQPIEHLASLRAMPGITVIRPCDANETAVAWQVAIERREEPVALVLTRQNVPTLDRSKYASADGLRRGAYVLSDAKRTEPDLVIIATGSEVHPALDAQVELAERGIAVRIVSMPSWELFEAQPAAYRDSVLLPSVKARIAVEAASSFGWSRWVGEDGDVVCIDRFGVSAPAKVLMEKFGFTGSHIADRAVALIEQVAHA
jgi:transketolase